MSHYGENVCFIQPSKELIRQTKDNLEKKGSKPVSIDSSDSETYGPVQMRLEKFLHRVTPVMRTKKEHFQKIANEKKRKQWPQSPEQLMEIEKDCNVLLITHEAFKGCPNFQGKQNWNLIVDEIPNVIPYYRFNLEGDATKLKEFSSVIDSDREDEYKVVVKDIGILNEIINRDNDTTQGFRKFAIDLRNENFTLFCSREQWDRVGTKDKETGEVYKQIEIFGLMNPSIFNGFKSVTVMGAHCDESLMYQIWLDTGFSKSVNIVPRNNVTTLGNRQLTIRYLSKKDWSKRLRDKVTKDDLADITNIFAGQNDVIYATNNDDSMIGRLLPRAQHIPNVSHGINSYSHISCACVATAMNLSPAHNKFLDNHFDTQREEIKRAIGEETIYQLISRTSLRDPNSTADVLLVVPDKRSAEGIARNYKGNVVVKQINTTCKALLEEEELLMPNSSPRERRKSKYEKVVKLQNENKELLKSLKSGQFDIVPTPTFSASANTDLPENRAHEGTPSKKQILQEINSQFNKTVIGQLGVKRAIHLSIISNIYSKEIHPVVFEDENVLVDEMGNMANIAINSKQDNILISPGTFIEKEGVDTVKGKENVVMADCIWMDNDSNELTPKQMREIVPSTHFIGMNTFTGQGRTRFLFPTTTPMTAESYPIVWELLYDKIAQVCPKNKIDQSKKYPFSWFYLPSQAKDVVDNYFEVFLGQDVDPNTLIEDYKPKVEKIAVTLHKNPRSQALSNLVTTIQQQPVNTISLQQQIVSNYRANKGADRTVEYNAFYYLFLNLQKLGLPKYEVETILKQEANFDSTRLKQTAAFMKKWK